MTGSILPPWRRGSIHHLELWSRDLSVTEPAWTWLLSALGYRIKDRWLSGVSFELAGEYIVVESGPDVVGHHDRQRPGINHVAFWAGTREQLDHMVEDATTHGWSLLFENRHPFAGGPDHYAAYLENDEGFEVELVAE